MSLIMDATAQPGLTVTRERLAAVHADVTVRLGFNGVLVPGGRWSARSPSTRRRACDPTGCA